MSNKFPPTFNEAYRALSSQIANGKVPPETTPSSLSTKKIHICEAVFQHRKPLAHHSEQHVKELAKAPEQGKDLHPITVWWDGKGWMCIDGHHRLKAYRLAASEWTAPVEVFTGSLEDAVAKAAEGNTRNKLPMSPSEKTETAWRLTISDASFSKAKIVSIAMVGEGTVANMRKVKAKLLKDDPEQDLSRLSWAHARMIAAGRESDWDGDVEGVLEKEAQELANILARHLGKRGSDRREAFARALEIYDAKLPEFLVEHWELQPEEDEWV